MFGPHIGQLVQETIFLKRIAECEHDWKPLNEQEEGCAKCGVAATPAGKAKLADLQRRFLPKAGSGE